jgi:tripartite-type tricarboxylate transporter receptor subunit TctC
MQRRSLLLSLSMLSLGTALHAQTAADTGTIYIPFPAGGSSDVFGRILAPSLSRQLQRNLIVENLAGASGSIAARKVLSRGGGGDALFLASPTETILAPATLKSAGYKPADFRMVGLISRVPLGVYVRADLPVQTIDELVAHARSRKDAPLSYGSVGIGSVYHLAGHAFMQAVGAPMTHVPYKGGAPLMQDLMGGQLDMVLFPADGNAITRLSGGKMRMVGITSPTRSPLFPNAGTFAESKSLPKFSTVDVWGGLFVSKATPEATVQTLHRAFQAALEDPDARKTMDTATGGTMAPAMTLEQLARFYSAESQRFENAVKQANIELN